MSYTVRTGAAVAGAGAGAAGGGRKLPKTASPMPLVGLSGGIALLAGLGLTIRRRVLHR